MGRYTIQRSTKELSATRASAIEHMIQEVNYINSRYATFDLPGPDRHIHKFRIGLIDIKKNSICNESHASTSPGQDHWLPVKQRVTNVEINFSFGLCGQIERQLLAPPHTHCDRKQWPCFFNSRSRHDLSFQKARASSITLRQRRFWESAQIYMRLSEISTKSASTFELVKMFCSINSYPLNGQVQPQLKSTKKSAITPSTATQGEQVNSKLQSRNWYPIR